MVTIEVFEILNLAQEGVAPINKIIKTDFKLWSVTFSGSITSSPYIINYYVSKEFCFLIEKSN